jgi:hypothetical protein
MRIGNVYISFVYELAYMMGTEQYVRQETLEKIAKSAIDIPGDKNKYFMIFGEWSQAVQVPEKVILLFTEQDGKYGLESIFKCDNYCHNCPVEDCLNRTSAFDKLNISVIDL